MGARYFAIKTKTQCSISQEIASILLNSLIYIVLCPPETRTRIFPHFVAVNFKIPPIYLRHAVSPSFPFLRKLFNQRLTTLVVHIANSTSALSSLMQGYRKGFRFPLQLHSLLTGLRVYQCRIAMHCTSPASIFNRMRTREGV